MGQDRLVIKCSGLFQDSGGNNGDYQANEDEMMVICSDNTKGTHIKLTFSNSDIAPGDALCFYDGNDINAPLLSCSNDFFPGSPFVIQATAANGTGCLTITFNSDSSVEGKGWNALIDCIPACQLIQVDLAKSDPPSVPADTGWIDVCIGERIFFEGEGIFPQNNLVYEHSAASSIFEWDFGDGITGKGPNVSHAYKESGGYKVELTVTDQFGCKSSNFITQRVRVSTKPVFMIADNFPNEVCVGDTVRLNGGIAGSGEATNITVTPTQGAFQTRGVRSDSLALPDGNGRSYETSISFTDYRPGEVLTSLEDLKSICLNMEHSWLHDMEIFITCPNGKNTKLQEQVLINDEVFLGNPNDDDGINPTAGQGKEYCWTPNATFGTFTEFANRENDSDLGEPYHLPEGSYNTFSPLTQLIGCPLNGEWTITITDLWEQDNGWIFSWGIEFDPALIPQLEVYEPTIATFQWADHPTIINKTPADEPRSIDAIPMTPGMVSYTFETIDDYGCRNDTSIQVKVLPDSHPDCLSCDKDLFAYDEISICEGDAVNLGAYIKPSTLGAVTFENQENAEFGKSTGQAAYTSTIAVSGVTPNTISSSLEELVSVCVDIETNFTGEITLALGPPSGRAIILSKENGKDSNDYTQTCFSPIASNNIENSQGPFTGVFAAEDSFSSFQGETINGDWRLTAQINQGNFDLIESNIFKSWSISFKGEDEATFSWSPGVNISNTIGVNTTLQAEENTPSFYVLTKAESGCVSMDTIQVNIIKSDITVDVNYSSFEGGEVLFYWTPIADASAIQISADGINWRDTDDDFFHREKGFQNGEVRNYNFRAIFSNQGCETDPTPIVVNYEFCDLAASLFSQNNITCAGGNDGALVVVAEGGTLPYSYVLNDSIEQTNGNFDNLSAGIYEVLVFDNNRICADTLSATITSPDSLGINFVITPPNCFDTNNGTITATPFGGVGGFSNFTWQGRSETTTSLNNLSEGAYVLTVLDAAGCTVEDTAIVAAPPVLTVDSTQTPVTCFGGLDGSAGVKVKGGTPPYAYEWSDNQSTADAVGLGIGTYSVTVSDDAGCTNMTEAVVTQPEPIEIAFKATSISCADEQDASLIAEPSGGIPPYKYRWENDQSNKLNFGLGEGTYFVTVIDAKGCEEVASENITSTTVVEASLTTTPPLCAKSPTGSITINPSGGTGPYTYLWDDSLAQTSQTAENLLAGIYSVTVTDINGCETVLNPELLDAKELEISPSGREASCPDKSDGFGEIEVNGGAMPYQYQWENGNQTALQTDLAPGKYPFTVTDNNGCQQVDTVVITSPAALEVDTFLKVLPACNGEANGSITARITGGSTPYAYEWEVNFQQNPIVGIPAGFYDLKVSDNRGCELSVSNIQLEEPNSLSITTSRKDVLCFGMETGEAIAIPMGGTPPYKYRWSDGKNQNDSIATNLMEGTYTVTVEDNNGCQDQSTATIAQPSSALLIEVEQTKIGCAGANNSEAAIVASGGTGTDYSYQWATLNTVSANAIQLETKTHFVTVTDENNCAVTSSIDIQELAPIEVNLISQKPSCFNTSDGSIVVSGVSGGIGVGDIDAYNYSWNNSNTGSIIDNLKGDSIYQVTVTDAQNCSTVAERLLDNANEIALISNQIDLACFQNKSGAITIDGLTNNEVVAAFDWSHSNIQNASFDSLEAGTYRVSVTTESGCTVTEEFNITEPEELVVTDIEIIPNDCFGEEKGSIQFNVLGGITNYSYSWSNNATEPNLQNIRQGTYTVTVTDGNNCTTEETFLVESPDSLIENIVAEATSCLDTEDGRLELNPIGGTPPYMYSLDGNRFQPSNRFIGLSAGTYTTYIRDSKGCMVETPNTAINPGDVILLEIDAETEELAIGDSTILTAISSSEEGGIQLSWSSNSSESFSCLDENCASILIKPQSSTKFEVYAIDDAGCEAEASLFLRLSNPKKVFVPTGFSPNNDGFNDVLLVHGQSNIRVNYFRIYDRWGEEIFAANDFSVNDPAIYWDGTFRGQRLNSSVFTWIMEVEYIDQQREIFKGNTTLFK